MLERICKVSLVSLLIFFFLMPGYAQGGPNQSPPTNHSKKQANTQAQIAPPTTVADSESAANAANSKQAGTSQVKVEGVNDHVTVATVVMAGVAVATFLVIIVQCVLMGKALAQTRLSNELTERALTIAERPWLLFTGPEVTQQIHTSMPATISRGAISWLSNFGKSPAAVLCASTQIVESKGVPKFEDFKDTLFDVPTNPTIPPGARYGLWPVKLPETHPYTGPGVYIICAVRYTSILGSTHETVTLWKASDGLNDFHQLHAPGFNTYT